MRVLKAFDYSTNGVNRFHLEPGDDPAGVPEAYVAGLVAEGFLGEGEPERKVIEAAPETGAAEPLQEPKARPRKRKGDE